jgi:hypothetical protein
MRRLPGCIAAALTILTVLCVATPAGAATKVAELEGSVMVQSGKAGPANEVGADTTFSSGDVITCTPDSRIQVETESGTLLSIVGPAEVQLQSFGEGNTSVLLVSGLINVARAKGTMLVRTEYPVSLQITDSTGYAEVVSGDRMRFAALKGDGVVLDLVGEEPKPLAAGDLPYIIDLKKLDLARTPLQPKGSAGGPVSPTGEILPTQGAYRLGQRTIRVYPPDRVRVERMSDGGLKLTGSGLGENEFARIEVGYEAVLYVTQDQYVVVDEYGNVDEFTGTSFITRPIDRRAFDYEPVKDAADSSPIRTRSR